MLLCEADAHLHFARLELDVKYREKARVHAEKAKKLIEETGYHRRENELAEIMKKLRPKAQR